MGRAHNERTVTRPSANATLTRRDFVGAVSSSAAAVLGGCGKRAGGRGSATNARDVAAVLPKYIPAELLKPDISGGGILADGYLHYPDPSRFVHAVGKPSSSGRVIKSMTPWWGPTPPGLGNNAYLEAVNRALGVTIDPSVQDGNTYADKISAILGARDVPELLCTPTWEIDKIPRYSQAVKALFADLTDYLKGDAVQAYPLLAGLPTSAWQHCVWNGRLSAIPFPTDGVFPYALFYRKDITNQLGVEPPKTIDELYRFGKKATNPGKGVWAFSGIFNMVQMFFKCPGSKGGWRKKAGGGLEFKYETPEYRQALEFTARLYQEGMVHPDIVASRGGDSALLFNAGKILMREDGVGAWRRAQSEQANVTPGYNMQPVPIFSAIGGDPLAWGAQDPVFYTFIKKNIGKDRTEELLRILNWLAAPLGTIEYELATYGVEGKHFTRAPDKSPIPTPLGRKELAQQFPFLGGRPPAIVGTADVPHYVQDLFAYSQRTVQYLEEDLFKGIKLEFPPNYSKILVITEDRLSDVLRGRRPLSDLDQIVRDWRRTGGDEGRAFFEKALADNGR
jgi:putative aldouronate transport system substrate-binding protein